MRCSFFSAKYTMQDMEQHKYKNKQIRTTQVAIAKEENSQMCGGGKSSDEDKNRFLRFLQSLEKKQNSS
jgi:hypothetical protein